jgi:hypothetical protein
MPPARRWRSADERLSVIGIATYSGAHGAAEDPRGASRA